MTTPRQTIPRTTIPLSRPDVSESDIEAVVRVLRTPNLSLGPKLEEFEERFAAYIGVRHAVALSSGTAGLHLALEALGVGEGDDVILPSFAFVAAANAVVRVRATPVFAEIHPVTLNLTAESIARVISPRTRAILLVHTFGYPADLETILALAREHNLRVIEDACEAVGAEYHGRKVGRFGDAGVFSFYPNKALTTGEGGMLVTSEPALARTARALRNQGRCDGDGWLEHALAGYNYRLPDINCALGISQLERLESMLALRESVAKRYAEVLGDCRDIVLPEIHAPFGRISWFVFVVRLPKTVRDRVIERLTGQGIGCRAYFPPIHLQPRFAKYRLAGPDLDVTEDIAYRTLALPFFNQLRPEEIEEVCSALRAAM